jgi:hypothetical protein
MLSCFDRGSIPVADEDSGDSDAAIKGSAGGESYTEQSSGDAGTDSDQASVRISTETCGNGIVEEGEQCDGEEFRPEITCESLGYVAGGTLTCDRKTCTFDISVCLSGPKCGNGIVETGEQCEAEIFKGMKCSDLERGFSDGDVTCNPDTCRFDLSNCGIESECGNGILEGAEQCDGSELNHMTCVDLNYGYSEGTLGCDPDTCTYDISDCEFPQSCGNGIVEPGEQCDGTNLSGGTCTGLGYAYGTLACSSDCRYDASECSNNTTNVICTRGGCFPISPFDI